MKINAKNSPLFALGKAKWNDFVSTYSGPYDLSPAVYAGMNHKIDFICPAHGRQNMDAKNMMAGKTCQKCSFEARKGRVRFTNNKMIERFNLAHGSRYDYSKSVYEGQRKHVEIICHEHGSFWQLPEFHWKGSGCPICYHENIRGASQRDSLESFCAKVEALFGNLFDFSNTTYVNSQTYIDLRCTKHDEECHTKPNFLVNGYNPCPKCNHMKSSGEDEIASYVSLFTPIIRRNRKILNGKELDVYAPARDLAVEYCGVYWHSCKSPEEERDNKLKHHQKYLAAKQQNIHLLTVYQSEWKDRKPQIKRLLRNLLGKSKGRLMARKCQVGRVSHTEARDFFDKYHVQGGEGTGEHYGLFCREKLVACMRFTFGSNDRGAAAKTACWTLSRYATRIQVVGGASKLFKIFLDEHNPKEVKSFSDNRYFDGAMYERLGFTLEKELGPDYQVWSPRIGLKPKSRYQRRLIPARLADHGIDDTFDPDTDSRTEAEMTFLMGCGRIYDCGKKKWVWRLDTATNQA